MDFKVTSSATPLRCGKIFGKEITPEKAYVIQHYKSAIDDKGNAVSIEDRVETVTKTGLEAQIAVHQKAIDALQEKLDAIPKEA